MNRFNIIIQKHNDMYQMGGKKTVNKSPSPSHSLVLSLRHSWRSNNQRCLFLS